MIKKALSLLFVLFFVSSCFAATSTDALDFVGRQNYFLEDGEQHELNPNTKISYNEKDFWVVSVFLGDAVTFFVPLEDDKELELANGEITRRKLVETAYSLQLLQKVKSLFLNQGKWVFSQGNSSFFNNLSLYFKEKKGKLEIVRGDLSSFPEIQELFPSADSKLDSLSALSQQLSVSLSETVNTEATVFAEPDVNSVSALIDSYDSGLELVFELNQVFSELSNEISDISNSIARSDLDSATKFQMNETISVSDNFGYVSSWNQSALQISSSLAQIESKASKDSDTFLQVLSIREKKNEAAHFLYSPKESISEKTENSYESLAGLASALLGDPNSGFFEDQEAFAELDDNWRKATKFYAEAKYDIAIDYGKKAEKNSLSVFQAGYAQPDTDIVNEELLITGLAILIVLLIIIYGIKNREKIFSLSNPGGDEDVEIDAFSKI